MEKERYSYMDKEDKFIESVYSKRKIELVRGKGAMVFDSEGKEYIDCFNGQGVALVGHGVEEINSAVKEQMDKISVVALSFYNDLRAEFGEKLASISPKGMTQAFLANSGTEAIECAIKLSKKYTGKPGIVAMSGGFHGRSLGALSATWKPMYRKQYEPLLPEFSHAKFNDIESLKQTITEKTGAVMLELVQGEKGVVLADKEYVKELREFCTEKELLLIIDDVQAFARTGNFFSSQTYNIVPDITAIAKGMAGGIPMGACIASPEIMDAFKPGDHGTTMGGNPIACAAGTATIDYIQKNNLIEHGASMGERMLKGLKELESFDVVREARGIGAMLALEYKFKMAGVLPKIQESGVIPLTSGKRALRFLPPLCISEEQADKVIEVTKKVTEEFTQ